MTYTQSRAKEVANGASALGRQMFKYICLLGRQILLPWGTNES